MSKVLDRPVTVGKIGINPYTLRLDVDQLHIAERDGKTPFVDIGHLHVNAAWSSLFRRAPVIEELSIDAPRVRIVRTADQRFNFSDIVDRLSQPENPPKPKSEEPARFVFANLQLSNGAIDFVDQPLGTQHKVDALQIGVPFLASLPADVNIFVQPLLAAHIDGAPCTSPARRSRLPNRSSPTSTSRSTGWICRAISATCQARCPWPYRKAN